MQQPGQAETLRSGSELYQLLRAATHKLDRLAVVVAEADEDSLAGMAPELHLSDRAIRAAAERRQGTPSAEEAAAFRAWQEAAARFRSTAHRRLEELDDRIHSLRMCNRALRAYGGQQAHHKAQTLQKKL
jgi:hypothetical protein